MTATTPDGRPTTPLWRQRRVQIGVAIAAVVLIGVGAAFALSGGGDDTPAAPGATTTSTTTTTVAGPTIAPLTGLPDPTGASLTRPVLLAKVDNITSSNDRPPQAGIDQADVVWEEPVEGTTRLLAAFNSQAPVRVGPIRSTRYLDSGIGWFFGHVPFVYSGGAAGPVAAIDASPYQVIDETGLIGIEARERDPDFNAPHNLFMFPEKVWAWAQEKQPPAPLFVYRKAGESATGIGVQRVEIPNFNRATYSWDPAAHAWLREQLRNSSELEPHLAESGKQVAPANVIVQRINGSLVQEDMVGEGDAWVFTDGKLIVGRWQRSSLDDQPVFLDASGTEIALTPGPTWISIITEGEPKVLA